MLPTASSVGNWAPMAWGGVERDGKSVYRVQHGTALDSTAPHSRAERSMVSCIVHSIIPRVWYSMVIYGKVRHGMSSSISVVVE